MPFISRAASYYLSLAESGHALTRKQQYVIACDVSPLVSTGVKNIKHAIQHPVQHAKDTFSGKLLKDTTKDLKRGYGNQAREDEGLPPINENSMISVKDIIKHHKTHEDVHRAGYEKFKKSDFPGTKQIAHRHRSLWHHHAGIRTRYEAIDRQGKTHVSQRQYERDTQGRFASFSLSLVDEVVLGKGYALARKDPFGPAREAKHQRQVLPRAHYVFGFKNATAFVGYVKELYGEHVQIKTSTYTETNKYKEGEDTETRRVRVDVEASDPRILHAMDSIAKQYKAQQLNSSGNRSRLEPTAMVRQPKPYQQAQMGETAVFILPEKRGMKFSRDVKRFSRQDTPVEVAVRSVVGRRMVVVAVRVADPHIMTTIKHWGAQWWGAHEVSSAEFQRGQELK